MPHPLRTFAEIDSRFEAYIDSLPPVLVALDLPEDLQTEALCVLREVRPDLPDPVTLSEPPQQFGVPSVTVGTVLTVLFLTGVRFRFQWTGGRPDLLIEYQPEQARAFLAKVWEHLKKIKDLKITFGDGGGEN